MIFDDLFSLKGRVALVTGASSGIGLHIAKLFASAGAMVALAARRTDRIESAVQELIAGGYRACGLYLDVLDSTSIDLAFKAAENHFGAPINLLFNNAGLLYAKRFIEQDEREVGRIIDTNLKGAFLVAQAAARRMSSAGGGIIINVGSTAGLRPGGLLSSYAASKSGLIHLSKVMALELAHKGIRVNVLCPGNIETDMHETFREGGLEEPLLERIPQRRFGKLEDLDGAALLLASDAGRYITGAVIPVDGGQLLSWM